MRQSRTRLSVPVLFYPAAMPHDSYHGDDKRALGRRVRDLHEAERLQVSCASCSRTTIYGWTTFRSFRFDCPLTDFEQHLPPRCWEWGKAPADCVREIVWLDASAEDVGVSEEG